MVRFSLLAAGLLVSILSIGCCGPMGCGPGCGSYACNDCDGGCGPTMACSPMDGMRQFKRSLVCGGGCGEAYMGEWISTPPDACDPCCGDQWVGGATACRPFCWQPGALLSRLQLYGQRCRDAACGDACCDPCDVGCGCDTCCDEGYSEYGGYEEVEVYDGGVISGGSDCGCASCGPKNPGMSRMASGSRGMSTGPLMQHRINRIRR
jgi:hypothetical protein